MEKKTMQLGEILISLGIITNRQLQEALEYQQEHKVRLGTALIALKFVTEREIFYGLEQQYQLPYIDLSATPLDKGAANMINETLARKYNLIPYKKENDWLYVATSDPLDLYALDDVKLMTGLEIKTVMASADDILHAIDVFYGHRSAEEAVTEIQDEMNFEVTDDLAHLTQEEIANAPAVRLVDSILRHAVRLGASDIHIEPTEDGMKTRLRVDGQLQIGMKANRSVHGTLVTRIKIMSNLDIAEKRIPQDGRIEMEIDGHEVDLRISTLPTIWGEKIVIRILNQGATRFAKNDLGFTAHNMALFDQMIKSPHGIILVCGPTGSGKSTTLYAVLTELNQVNVNVITVEDPVEYRLEGITQVQVNSKAGMDFSTGLRSILRQDPDIVMVGEIRDGETASIAMRASITGHLVLSTLHTNDAAATITRLADMGIEPFLISSALVGVISQRLVRKICPRCKEAHLTDDKEMQALRINSPVEIYHGRGCNACQHSGYAGRLAVHEVMTIDKNLRSLIIGGANTDEIRQGAIAGGMVTLRGSCAQLVLNGTTTMEEYLKITYNLED